MKPLEDRIVIQQGDLTEMATDAIVGASGLCRSTTQSELFESM